MKGLNKKVQSKLSGMNFVPSKVFLALFLFSAVVCILALRSNNQTMIELRNEVYEADRQGGDVNAALDKLRKHVYGHMNTDLSSGANAIRPPIQLKYTYERLMTAEKERVDAINERIYSDAQAYCERLYPGSFSGGPRVPCVSEYVERNGAKPNTIPPALYQFDFVSPSWSPDLAGWSLVAAIVFFVGFAFSFTMEKLMKTKLKPW